MVKLHPICNSCCIIQPESRDRLKVEQITELENNTNDLSSLKNKLSDLGKGGHQKERKSVDISLH